MESFSFATVVRHTKHCFVSAGQLFSTAAVPAATYACSFAAARKRHRPPRWRSRRWWQLTIAAQISLRCELLAFFLLLLLFLTVAARFKRKKKRQLRFSVFTAPGSCVRLLCHDCSSPRSATKCTLRARARDEHAITASRALLWPSFLLTSAHSTSLARTTVDAGLSRTVVDKTEKQTTG